MLKQGREVKTQLSEVFRTSYGTVDMSNLKSVFVNLSTWAEPLEDKESWVRPIKKFENRIKNSLHGQLKETPFKDKAIVDLDLRASGIKTGKRSFMRCEITLFIDSKNKFNIKSPFISTPIKTITTNLIEKSILPSTTFTFHKTKK
jgi:hypothetical protein|tara:strand:+ start:1540 stop:1977 length:438 start_codon:yes stop_codon:yes gene_type:complete